MTEDRDKWRKYVMVWPTLRSMTAKEQKNTVSTVGRICGKGRFKPGIKE